MTEASKIKKEDTFTSIRSFGEAVTLAALPRINLGPRYGFLIYNHMEIDS